MVNDLNTKELIRDTFIELYRNKNIKDIRVTSLTQKAFINRGTFYLYYDDIYDLRREIEDDLLDSIKELVNKENPKNIFIMDIDEITKYFTPVLDFINKNRRYMESLLSNGSDDYFENTMKEVVINNIKNGINHTEESVSNYIVEYMVSANIAVIKTWLKDINKTEPKEIALLISNFTMKGPIGFKK